MTQLEKRRMDREFEIFINRNFEKPRKCKNDEQIRFYVRELTSLIKKMENNRNHVPGAAYQLLAQYNQKLNKNMYADFRSSYC